MLLRRFDDFWRLLDHIFGKYFNDFRLNDQLKCFLSTNRKFARCFRVYKVFESVGRFLAALIYSLVNLLLSLDAGFFESSQKGLRDL